MENCVFCKIVQGQLPSKKTYEDDSIVAFHVKEPVSNGHVVVIPREHYENVFDIPESILQKLIVVTKQLSAKSLSELNATGVNLLNASGKDAQQSVNHFHMHIVPRYPNDGLDLWIKVGIEK